MARIKNTDVYVFDNVPESSSFLVGSDQGDGRITKSYRIDTIFGILPSYGYFTDAPKDGQPYLRQNGSWALVPASGVGSVFSVFGQTGAIEAKEADYKDFYSLLGHTHTESDIIDLGDYLESVNISDINTTGSANSNTFLRGDGVWADASNVDSVFGRGGEVTAEEGDYSGFYSLLGHTHDSSEITDFNSELSGKNNTTEYTPTGDYNVSTKKYVDDSIASYNLVTGVFGRDGEVTAEEGDYSGFYSLLGHTHLESDITDLGDYLESVNIGDINALGTPTSDNFLRGDGNWASIATSLSGLSDVTLGAVSSGEVLRHNGTIWENKKITIADIDNFPSYELLSNKGASNGYAPLNASGLIDSGYLPSFVDDVLEFNDYASFPVTGEVGKIYIDLYENNLYRWGGSNYIPVGGTEAINWGSITGTLSNQTDLQSALDGKLGTLGTAYDSNLLGGLNSAQFLRSDTSDTMNGTLGITGNLTLGGDFNMSGLFTLQSTKIRDNGSDTTVLSSNYGSNGNVVIRPVGDQSTSGQSVFSLSGLDVTGRVTATSTITSQDYILTNGSANGLRLKNPTRVGDAADIYLTYYDADSNRKGYVGFGSQTNSSLVIRNDKTAKNLILEDGGNLSYNGEVFASGNLNGTRLYVSSTSGNLVTASNQVKVDGYGIMGNRGTMYFTNGFDNGEIRLGNSGIHNFNPILGASSNGITAFQDYNFYTTTGAYGRLSHNSGHLEGSYNNVGANANRTNPIYCIGSSYTPNEFDLGPMYGIGFSESAASFLNSTDLGTTPSGWGCYIASDGNARIFLDSTGGRTYQLGVAYASNFILNSDKRRKNNIEDYDSSNLDVKWKSFELNTEKGVFRVGVVAQELLETNPEFVDQSDPESLTVKYIDLLCAKNAQLEERVEMLEEKLNLIVDNLL
ncbi:tail protein [Cellulophaga phage Calle_3]|nr:tail protein [Cellulophaga phage Calle_3]